MQKHLELVDGLALSRGVYFSHKVGKSPQQRAAIELQLIIFICEVQCHLQACRNVFWRFWSESCWANVHLHQIRQCTTANLDSITNAFGTRVIEEAVPENRPTDGQWLR